MAQSHQRRNWSESRRPGNDLRQSGRSNRNLLDIKGIEIMEVAMRAHFGSFWRARCWKLPAALHGRKPKTKAEDCASDRRDERR